MNTNSMFYWMKCISLPFIIVTVFVASKPVLATEADPPGETYLERVDEILERHQKIIEFHEQEIQRLKEKVDEEQSLGDEQTESTLEKTETKKYIQALMHSIRLTDSEESPEEEKLKTLYDDGFFLIGEDDHLRIGGWLQFDSRFYLDENHPENDTFLIRRARLDVRGILEDYWAYRLYGTFVGERNGILQEGWLEYRKYGGFRIRAGQFVEPFSLEAVYSARWIDFTERAMAVDALAPTEDMGIMAFGLLFDNQVSWAAGFFNGQGRNHEAVVDDKDFTARIVYSPFLDAGFSPALEKLYVGGSFSYGNNDRELDGSDFQTQGRTDFFDFQPGVVQNDRLTRWGLEAEYLYGPFSAKTEYLEGRFDEIRKDMITESLDVSGYYLNIGYFLTGETAPRDESVDPISPFAGFEGGCGAWQLVGRYQLFDTDDDLLNSGLAIGTDNVRSVTIGLNWYPNKHLRFQFNYDRAWFDDDILVDGVKLSNEDTISTRLQYNF